MDFLILVGLTLCNGWHFHSIKENRLSFSLSVCIHILPELEINKIETEAKVKRRSHAHIVLQYPVKCRHFDFSSCVHFPHWLFLQMDIKSRKRESARKQQTTSINRIDRIEMKKIKATNYHWLTAAKREKIERKWMEIHFIEYAIW